MSEIWKDIEGYEGLYKVSNLGRIKSLPKFHKTRYSGYMKKERILKPRFDTYGYLMVVLCKNKKEKNYLVHKLVANAFIPNTKNYDCINHKDEDKTNNCVDNLEWCDRYYNNNYGTRNKRISDTMRAKYSEDGVVNGIF